MMFPMIVSETDALGCCKSWSIFSIWFFRWYFWRKELTWKQCLFQKWNLKVCISFHTNYTGIEKYVLIYSILCYYCLILLTIYVFACFFRTWRQAFQKWEMSCSHGMLSGEECNWNATSCIQNYWKSESIKICRKFK